MLMRWELCYAPTRELQSGANVNATPTPLRQTATTSHSRVALPQQFFSLQPAFSARSRSRCDDKCYATSRLALGSTCRFACSFCDRSRHSCCNPAPNGQVSDWQRARRHENRDVRVPLDLLVVERC